MRTALAPVVPPAVAPAPVTSSAIPQPPSGVQLTADQFLSWMNLQKHVQLQSAVAAKMAVKPRIGGISAIGIWTGFGENKEGQIPVSEMALREFFASGMKSYSHKGVIDRACKAGLPSITGAPIFSQAHEADGSKLVRCLIALKEFLTDHGMEGVFTIVRPYAQDVNMLKNPGHVNEDMVSTWIKDLTVQGVYCPRTQTRLPVCPYDAMNLVLSGKAILNSCSPALKEAVQRAVLVQNLNGPTVLLAVIQRVSPPSYTVTRDLCDKLKVLSIKKIPGENMAEYQTQALALVDEIRMSMIDPGQVPDLTVLCLQGVQQSSDTLLKARAADLMDKVDSALNSRIKPEPEDVLKDLVDVYNRRLARKTYEPAQYVRADATAALADASPMSLLVAKVSAIETTLKQDRGSSQRSYERKCYNCGKLGHVRPECPDLLSASTAPSAAPVPIPSSHGLDRDLARRCNELIKSRILELGDPKLIPIGAKHDIVIDGKVMAKYCAHCGRFVKGHNAHYTTEHTGPRSTTKFKPHPNSNPQGPPREAPASLPGPATAAVAAHPMYPPTVPSPSLLRCELPDYDTPSVQSPYVPDRQPSDYNAFLNCVDITDPFDLHPMDPNPFAQQPAVSTPTPPPTEELPYFSPSEWDCIMFPNWYCGHKG